MSNKEDSIKTVSRKDTQLFVTWKKGDYASLQKALNNLYIDNAGRRINRTKASTTYQDILPNHISIRESYGPSDYENYRPEETIPEDVKRAMTACNRAYKKVGLIRNVIDLMGDFAIQGIDIVHPNPQVEKFHLEWARRVGFWDRSERYANLLIRMANVIVKKSTAKLNAKKIREFKRGIAEIDTDVPELQPVERNEIPIKYTFLNPCGIDILDEEQAMFLGQPEYYLAISGKVYQAIQQGAIKIATVGDVVKHKGKRYIKLNPNKIWVAHYKKDDWEPWAYPMTYAILSDIVTLEKMKLADISALDGAISHIRLWKLGSLEHGIFPTDAAIQKLADILINNVGVGAVDLIWGPELTLEETSTDIHMFLGETKYSPILQSIYSGLGIPPTLTGTSSPSGFTNNAISLKTLIERLEYVRRILIAFWENEFRCIQRAFGFKYPAKLKFARMTLSDESAEKALILQAVDRGILSYEAAREKLGEDPELEALRIRREEKDIKAGRMPLKAGPWHDAQPEIELKKIALQSGQATPSEVGLELEENKDGERRVVDIKQERESKKLSGIPGQGRPKNSKDTKKRKQKRVLPRKASTTFISLATWAKNAQKFISDIVQPIFLEAKKKKNLRELTTEESKNLEKFKFAVLSYMKPFSEITEDVVEKIVTTTPCELNKLYSSFYMACNRKFLSKFDREPNMEENKQIQAYVYAICNGDYDGENQS